MVGGAIISLGPGVEGAAAGGGGAAPRSLREKELFGFREEGPPRSRGGSGSRSYSPEVRAGGPRESRAADRLGLEGAGGLLSTPVPALPVAEGAGEAFLLREGSDPPILPGPRSGRMWLGKPIPTPFCVGIGGGGMPFWEVPDNRRLSESILALPLPGLSFPPLALTLLGRRGPPGPPPGVPLEGAYP